MRFDRIILTTAALALGLSLGGCESFDLESIWSTKKPLPGDRRAVFPQGVPGVAQGYQPPAEPEPQAVAAPVEKPKPKAKPKPKQAAAPAQQPSSSAAQPASQQPSQVQWPETPRAGSQQATTPWPDPPASSR